MTTGTPLSNSSTPVSLPGGNVGDPPTRPLVHYRFPPIDPNKWYSVKEVALRYSTGDDYIRRTFRARLKDGHEGIKDEYNQTPGKRRWGFMRIKGSALLAWEQE